MNRDPELRPPPTNFGPMGENIQSREMLGNKNFFPIRKVMLHCFSVFNGLFSG
jgi:hypothetical protein